MKKIMFATLALTALVASNAGAHGSNPYLKAIMAEGINLDVRQATAVLAKAGFERVANLSGGMLRWRAQRFQVEGGAD